MKRNTDSHGRLRCDVVAVRVSPEERADLDRRVALSGLTKQEYVLRRISERDIIVQGNSRVFKALRNQMTDILSELRRLEHCTDATEYFWTALRTVAQTYNGLEETADGK